MHTMVKLVKNGVNHPVCVQRALCACTVPCVQVQRALRACACSVPCMRAACPVCVQRAPCACSVSCVQAEPLAIPTSLHARMDTQCANIRALKYAHSHTQNNVQTHICAHTPRTSIQFRSDLNIKSGCTAQVVTARWSAWMGVPPTRLPSLPCAVNSLPFIPAPPGLGCGGPAQDLK